MISASLPKFILKAFSSKTITARLLRGFCSICLQQPSFLHKLNESIDEYLNSKVSELDIRQIVDHKQSIDRMKFDKLFTVYPLHLMSKDDVQYVRRVVCSESAFGNRRATYSSFASFYNQHQQQFMNLIENGSETDAVCILRIFGYMDLESFKYQDRLAEYVKSLDCERICGKLAIQAYAKSYQLKLQLPKLKARVQRLSQNLNEDDLGLIVQLFSHDLLHLRFDTKTLRGFCRALPLISDKLSHYEMTKVLSNLFEISNPLVKEECRSFVRECELVSIHSPMRELKYKVLKVCSRFRLRCMAIEDDICDRPENYSWIYFEGISSVPIDHYFKRFHKQVPAVLRQKGTEAVTNYLVEISQKFAEDPNVQTNGVLLCKYLKMFIRSFDDFEEESVRQIRDVCISIFDKVQKQAMVCRQALTLVKMITLSSFYMEDKVLIEQASRYLIEHSTLDDVSNIINLQYYTNKYRMKLPLKYNILDIGNREILDVDISIAFQLLATYPKDAKQGFLVIQAQNIINSVFRHPMHTRSYLSIFLEYLSCNVSIPPLFAMLQEKLMNNWMSEILHHKDKIQFLDKIKKLELTNPKLAQFIRNVTPNNQFNLVRVYQEQKDLNN